MREISIFDSLRLNSNDIFFVKDIKEEKNERTMICHTEVMSSFEQRFTIQEVIFPFLDGPTLVRLCHIHRDFRSYLASFVSQMRKIITIKYPSERLIFAVENGAHSPNGRALCELVRFYGNTISHENTVDHPLRRVLCEFVRVCRICRDYGERASFHPLNWDDMLYLAAEYGDRDLCVLAREWCLAAGLEISWNRLLFGAAKSGHREICELVREWGPSRIQLFHMIWGAARCGHRDLCELAYKWMSKETKLAYKWMSKETGIDLRSWDMMLAQAAMGGHRELCELARSWGLAAGQPINWNYMLWSAARGGHRELCELAREWAREAMGPDAQLDWRDMLMAAALHGRRDLCILAHEWAREAGVTDQMDWDLMLWNATDSGHREVCELTREWAREAMGPDVQLDWNGMLIHAAYREDLDLCMLAREWGATIWDEMINGSIGGPDCQGWIAILEKNVPNLAELRQIAARYQYADIIELARSWIAERAHETSQPP